MRCSQKVSFSTAGMCHGQKVNFSMAGMYCCKIVSFCMAGLCHGQKVSFSKARMFHGQKDSFRMAGMCFGTFRIQLGPKHWFYRPWPNSTKFARIVRISVRRRCQ
jgi:hypothetical protein